MAQYPPYNPPHPSPVGHLVYFGWRIRVKSTLFCSLPPCNKSCKKLDNSNITRLGRMVSNVFLLNVQSLEKGPLRCWQFCVLLSPYLQEWRFIWEFFKWMQAEYWTQVYWQTQKRPNVSFWCHNLISSIITFLRSCLLDCCIGGQLRTAWEIYGYFFVSLAMFVLTWKGRNNILV